MGSIYLIRHGQASFDAEDYDQLSTLGMEQSRLLGTWMRSMGHVPDSIICGSAKRHKQTAQSCLQAWREDLNEMPEDQWLIDSGFDEFDHQEVLLKHAPQFVNFAELKQFVAAQSHPRRAFQELFTAAVQQWVSGEYVDYSETWIAFQQRCRNALQQACAKEGKIWIFTSGGTISAILQQVLGISDERIFDLNASLVNSGVTRLHYRPNRISLSFLNSSTHLEMHQAPALMSYR